ncbi:hypothetical protein AYL99_09748 [Fonsecaea erecta]|uniref:Uncharacterized protein n=1 Tax=Fonsecaea erecta TaxID=1367422 RepID=A0A178Z763_9EURO|nr:hypothetical protein AYL99_09748 [Fonsecaea erecta]OAP55597.1 hypothetical protein AYL99_09748 [Fonsecaea erecta]
MAIPFSQSYEPLLAPTNSENDNRPAFFVISPESLRTDPFSDDEIMRGIRSLERTAKGLRERIYAELWEYGVDYIPEKPHHRYDGRTQKFLFELATQLEDMLAQIHSGSLQVLEACRQLNGLLQFAHHPTSSDPPTLMDPLTNAAINDTNTTLEALPGLTESLTEMQEEIEALCHIIKSLVKLIEHAALECLRYSACEVQDARKIRVGLEQVCYQRKQLKTFETATEAMRTILKDCYSTRIVSDHDITRIRTQLNEMKNAFTSLYPPPPIQMQTPDSGSSYRHVRRTRVSNRTAFASYPAHYTPMVTPWSTRDIHPRRG